MSSMKSDDKKQIDLIVAEGDLKVMVERARAEGTEQGKVLGAEEGRRAGIEEGRTAGLEEGAKQERERITAVLALSEPGYEKMVNEFAADGKTTAGEAAIKITEARKATRAAQLEAIKRDGQAPAPAAVATTTGEVKPATVAENLPVDERIKQEWDNDPKVRATHENFGGYDAYLALRKAELKGSARILRIAG